MHGKVHQNCLENSAPRTQIWAVHRMEAVDHHRVFKPSGSEIDDGYRNGHADATDEVARPLPDIEALTAAVAQVEAYELCRGHVELCRDCRLDIHPDTHVGLCRGVEAMSGSCRVMSSRGSVIKWL